VEDDRVGGADVESVVELATDVGRGVAGSLVVSDAAAGKLTGIRALDVDRGVDGSLVVSDAAAGNLMGVGAIDVGLAGRVFDASSMGHLELWIVDMLDAEERDVDTVSVLVWASYSNDCCRIVLRVMSSNLDACSRSARSSVSSSGET
jgi:hypothetical protein